MDAQVWGWGYGCPGMEVGPWMPRYDTGAGEEETDIFFD